MIQNVVILPPPPLVSRTGVSTGIIHWVIHLMTLVWEQARSSTTPNFKPMPMHTIVFIIHSD